MAIQKLLSLLFLQFMLSLLLTNAKSLKLGFYNNTCPNMEDIVFKTTYRYISRAPTLAAALLRLHFHDCFVRGCDGSVLLDSTNNNKAEKDEFPNLSLRGFEVIDAVKSAVEKKCPGVVSCADILAMAARDAVSMIHGPYWDVPTGRRDGRRSIAAETFPNLPPSSANITLLKQMFAAKGLNVKDLVVLSGGHTIGVAHCKSFSERLYDFSGKGDTDPSLDSKYAEKLRIKCKPGDASAIVEMDPGSFKTFDEDYYSLVSNRRVLFKSDAALLNDKYTRNYVKLQAATHGSSFANDFARSMVKMGKIGVLTGKAGEIRKQCAFVN
ncbi:peroxidase 27-like [Mangifera indica]|uniref:peroxidase 27-like n=1 Tax=Mangifera indica TaxID=29780 RepID=UPI001CFBEF47|nr:peroxidase 27-like [Mangifera indica]